jgi:hypothetical protein
VTIAYANRRCCCMRRGRRNASIPFLLVTCISYNHNEKKESEIPPSRAGRMTQSIHSSTSLRDCARANGNAVIKCHSPFYAKASAPINRQNLANPERGAVSLRSRMLPVRHKRRLV